MLFYPQRRSNHFHFIYMSSSFCCNSCDQSQLIHHLPEACDDGGEFSPNKRGKWRQSKVSKKVQDQLALLFSCLYLHGHFSGIFLVLFCYYCISWQEASIWITPGNKLSHERVHHLRPWTLSKDNLSLNVTKLQLCRRKINTLPRMNQAKSVWPSIAQVLNGQCALVTCHVLLLLESSKATMPIILTLPPLKKKQWQERLWNVTIETEDIN